MQQSEPTEGPLDAEERATEQRFAELLRRFWRRPPDRHAEQTDPGDQP